MSALITGRTAVIPDGREFVARTVEAAPFILPSAAPAAPAHAFAAQKPVAVLDPAWEPAPREPEAEPGKKAKPKRRK